MSEQRKNSRLENLRLAVAARLSDASLSERIDSLDGDIQNLDDRFTGFSKAYASSSMSLSQQIDSLRGMIREQPDFNMEQIIAAVKDTFKDSPKVLYEGLVADINELRAEFSEGKSANQIDMSKLSSSLAELSKKVDRQGSDLQESIDDVRQIAEEESDPVDLSSVMGPYNRKVDKLESQLAELLSRSGQDDDDYLNGEVTSLRSKTTSHDSKLNRLEAAVRGLQQSSLNPVSPDSTRDDDQDEEMSKIKDSMAHLKQELEKIKPQSESSSKNSDKIKRLEENQGRIEQELGQLTENPPTPSDILAKINSLSASNSKLTTKLSQLDKGYTDMIHRHNDDHEANQKLITDLQNVVIALKTNSSGSRTSDAEINELVASIQEVEDNSNKNYSDLMDNFSELQKSVSNFFDSNGVEMSQVHKGFDELREDFNSLDIDEAINVRVGEEVAPFRKSIEELKKSMDVDSRDLRRQLLELQSAIVAGGESSSPITYDGKFISIEEKLQALNEKLESTEFSLTESMANSSHEHEELLKTFSEKSDSDTDARLLAIEETVAQIMQSSGQTSEDSPPVYSGISREELEEKLSELRQDLSKVDVIPSYDVSMKPQGGRYAFESETGAGGFDILPGYNGLTNRTDSTTNTIRSDRNKTIMFSSMVNFLDSKYYGTLDAKNVKASSLSTANLSVVGTFNGKPTDYIERDALYQYDIKVKANQEYKIDREENGLPVQNVRVLLNGWDVPSSYDTFWYRINDDQIIIRTGSSIGRDENGDLTEGVYQILLY